MERVVESLARGFAERGHRVTVATAIPAATSQDVGLPYTVVRQPGMVQLARLVRQNDITHLAGPALLPMFLAWLLRRPRIIEHHVYQAICPNGLLLYEPSRTVCPGHFQAGRHRKCWQCNAHLGLRTSWRMWLLAFPRLWLSKRASANVAITKHVQNRLQLPNSLVIYHGVPVDPSEDVESLASFTEPFRFASVGRLVGEKGLPLLIEAAAQLKKEGCSFRLAFIGDGPERGRLESAVRSNGLEGWTTFTGMLGGEDLRRETSDLLAVVMPSVWEETAGMAAIENMMKGRAVIASDIGGLGEIVGDAGLKFPPGDAGALAASMRRLLEDSDLVRELGKRARLRARDLFRLNRRIDQHLELCATILRKPR